MPEHRGEYLKSLMSSWQWFLSGFQLLCMIGKSSVEVLEYFGFSGKFYEFLKECEKFRKVSNGFFLRVWYF